MKTSKVTSAIAIFSLLFFMSVTSIAMPDMSNTGDLPKSGNSSVAIAPATQNEFSYLRFDADKYMNENEEADAFNSSLNYLRFDVNNYVVAEESSAIILPSSNEFEYLRFDVNYYSAVNTDLLNGLPVNEYTYLRFDAAKYIGTSNSQIDELPVTE